MSAIKLMLVGDAMTRRGIDQILPHRVAPEYPWVMPLSQQRNTIPKFGSPTSKGQWAAPYATQRVDNERPAEPS